MKGVIFDLDGTMVDNMMVHHRAWQKKLADMGLELSLEEVRQQIHGINEEILERLFGDRFTPEQRHQYAFEKEATYREIFKEELALIDGLPAFLDDLKSADIPMAIGSAAPPENVDFVLDGLNIRSYFSAICHARNVTKGKPDPEIYLKVASQMAIDPRDCIVFEDSPTGAEAGHRAGCPLVIITTTHTEAEFQHLPNVLQFASDFRSISVDSLLNTLPSK